VSGGATLAPTPAAPGLRLLLGARLRCLRNVADQTLRTAPLRAALIALFLLAIWTTLFALFDRVFLFLHMFREQSVVVIPYVFHIFFVAMTVLLAFSTAILAYSGLFVRPEPAWLLPSPVGPRSIVAAVFLEAMFFSSWALLLLGLPMMAALGRVEQLPWHFYLTFLGAFAAFIPIPGACGLLAAWAGAMWIPRSARRVYLLATAMALVGALAWWGRLWSHTGRDAEHWLTRFLSELAYLRSALLPSTWVTNAISRSLHARPAEAAFYLFVTAAHAAFLAWLAVGIVARWVQPAFGRAQSAPGRPLRGGGALTRWLTEALFRYLPAPQRCLILKDLRMFVRDPLQWSQLAILFGLLGLYLFYLPTVQPTAFSRPLQALVCFLNYGAVALILSTFTSRFVFPLISLEGRQMWLLGLWPLARRHVLWAKFDFALSVAAAAALVVTGLSIRALELPWMLSLVQVAATLSTCVGLVGLAIGLGARFPTYGEPSGARIAGGLGGTINLIVSMALVLTSLALMGAICFRSAYVLGSLERLDALNGALYLVQMVLGFGAGAGAMRIGVRHFSRAEF